LSLVGNVYPEDSQQVAGIDAHVMISSSEVTRTPSHQYEHWNLIIASEPPAKPALTTAATTKRGQGGSGGEPTTVVTTTRTTAQH
jgi:hypothetical protein